MYLSILMQFDIERYEWKGSERKDKQMHRWTDRENMYAIYHSIAVQCVIEIYHSMGRVCIDQ